jgi:hypothetical protein
MGADEYYCDKFSKLDNTALCRPWDEHISEAGTCDYEWRTVLLQSACNAGPRRTTVCTTRPQQGVAE